MGVGDNDCQKIRLFIKVVVMKEKEEERKKILLECEVDENGKLVNCKEIAKETEKDEREK